MGEIISRQDCQHDNHGIEPHECPYLSELHKDDSLCTCCESCVEECAIEI